jgi:uncharacterized protein (TIGR03086 family)
VTYTKTAALPVTPDEAFALITQPERLRRWQTVAAQVDLRAGGEYRWTITPAHVAAGTYREVEPGKRVVFGWGWEGDDNLKPDGSTVTITVEPAEGGSLVTLIHDGLTEQQESNHAMGWDHYLGRLTAVATTGDAGPDNWAGLMAEELTPITASYAALAAIQPMLRNLTAEDQPKQTPCTDFTCHDVAVHLFASFEQLGAMAGATVVQPEQGPLENKISVMAAQAIDAWRSVDLEGSVPHGDGSELPASYAVGILPLEILLHGWDLAEASGQTLTVSDEVVAYMRGLADVVVPGGRPRGSFGDEVTPRDGADPMERLAAFAGRTPVAG